MPDIIILGAWLTVSLYRWDIVVLILDDSSTWPSRVSSQLNSPTVVDLLERNEYIDQIANDPKLIEVFTDIDKYAAKVGLAGYHCTKQLANRPYVQTGLRILDFKLHHSEFRAIIRDHHAVDADLYAYIDKRLSDWQANHTGKREGTLWFCLNRRLVLNAGTKSFFKYFGGEAIYFAFMDDPLVSPLLEELGDPVVVEARLAVSNLKGFRRFAFGRTLVSFFASTINPNFCIEGLEGYVSSDLAPDAILAVYPHAEYVALVTNDAV